MTFNPELDLAYHFVQFTGYTVFLTGKAGTGKTTFLHELKKTSLKRLVVVAPTGVAAINAGGVTIHSFFQLPFGPYVPHRHQRGGPDTRQQIQRFNREKINLLRSLDLLVIDEISMVRADTLDAIDEVLRRYKDRNQPFGGVQLLMIGDLHQLSPVIKEEEWGLLKPYYPNIYFFNSLSLQKTSFVNIELKHIYRQSDAVFIDLLNHIRENQTNPLILSKLNERHIPDFQPGEHEGYITLTTHNLHAKEINREKLESIHGKVFKFHADISNDFPEYAYPADPVLELKEGAQVMFVKNDPSRDKLFFNGKIGRITSMEEDRIQVSCPDDDQPILVNKTEWQNLKYDLNTSTKEIDERVAGTFTQYPLKLAWAITIHKSQGLTFEKAIIDAGSSFAHGQVYVALSRCKTFEGMVLRTPISMNSVKTDHIVAAYTRNAAAHPPGDIQLAAAKMSYQRTLLTDLFTFDTLKSQFFYCLKAARDHEHSLPPSFIELVGQLNARAERELYPVAKKFRQQLARLLVHEPLPEADEQLQERIKKACSWFANEIDTGLFVSSAELVAESDNKEVKKIAAEAVEHLRRELFIKLSSMNLCREGFHVAEYLKIRANAALDFESLKKNAAPKTSAAPAGITHPQLYATLKKWRDELAGAANVPVYRILPQKTLAELARTLPAGMGELNKIKGIGKQKAGQFGAQLLSLIREYTDQQEIPVLKEN